MDLNKFSIENITTIREGIEYIEVNYIDKVARFLKNGCTGDLDLNNANFTISVA